MRGKSELKGAMAYHKTTPTHKLPYFHASVPLSLVGLSNKDICGNCPFINRLRMEILPVNWLLAIAVF